MRFGAGYGGPTGFTGIMGGSTPGAFTGYSYRMPESSSGNPDGSDPIGTESEEFGMHALFNWHRNPALAGAEAVPIATSGVSIDGAASLDSAGGGRLSEILVPHTTPKTSASSKQQGPPPPYTLPLIYTPYDMALAAGGNGMTTSHGGPLMMTPMNVSLYLTTDFG